MAEDETNKPKKIRLLSADAMKAIYEREMAKKGLPAFRLGGDLSPLRSLSTS